MSSKAGALEGVRGPAFGPKEWGALAIVGLLALTALVMSVLALQRSAGTSTSVAPVHRAAAGAAGRGFERIADSTPVTGTGPDLVGVANASIQQQIEDNSEPVTGTGPGLLVIAQHVGVGVRPALITGTGPDLAMVGAHAMNHKTIRARRGSPTRSPR